MRFPWTLKRSARSRRMRITITPDAKVVVTIPTYISSTRAEMFVREKSAWIESKLAWLKATGAGNRPRLTKTHFKQHKEQARILAEERTAYFNTHYKFHYTTITIRNQKTRWGSCSKRGALSFNFRIALIAKELVDYVIVHELCHLGAMNHSKRFWDLVAETIPNHKALRRKLRLQR